MNLHILKYSIQGLPRSKTISSELQKVKTKMYKNLLANSQGDQAEYIQNSLNSIINSDEWKEGLVQYLTTGINLNDNDIPSKYEGANVYVTNKMQVTTSAYQDVFNRLNQEVKGTTDYKNIISEIHHINGVLAKYRGQIFENFLQIALPIIKQSAGNKCDETVDTVLSDFSQSLKSIGLSGEAIKTQGTEHDNSVTINLNNKTYTISSQGKTDVVVPAVEDNINKSIQDYVSAKNYSRYSDVHLVTNANLLGLISLWNLSDHHQNTLYHQFATNDMFGDSQLQTIKDIISMQALAGRRALLNDDNINYLIINIRSDENTPIRVISISKLLQVAKDNMEQYFDTNINIGTIDRTNLDKYADTLVSNLKVSSVLKKSVLYKNAMTLYH